MTVSQAAQQIIESAQQLQAQDGKSIIQSNLFGYCNDFSSDQ